MGMESGPRPEEGGKEKSALPDLKQGIDVSGIRNALADLKQEIQARKQKLSKEASAALDVLQNPDWDSILGPEKLKEVRGQASWPDRVVAAANLAYQDGIDVMTQDGNHCSGWVDTVFDMVGLDMYAPEHRLYVSPNYPWPTVGTLSGLTLQPGDSIIRENRTTGSKHHQEIILESSAPDQNGNYTITTLGQIKANEEAGTGERAVLTFTVPAEKIKVVIRPGATQPWKGLA